MFAATAGPAQSASDNSWCDSPDGLCAESGASSQELHLNEDEEPRPAGDKCHDGAFGAVSCP